MSHGLRPRGLRRELPTPGRPESPGGANGWRSLRAARRLAAGSILAAAAPLLAQPGPAPAPAPGAENVPETLFSLVVKGGWLMVPIGLCSIVVLTVAIERAISLRRRRTVPNNLLGAVLRILRAGRGAHEGIAEATALLERSRSCLASVLLAGVRRLPWGRERSEVVLEEAAAKQVHRLRRRLRPFSAITSLAPLLGLLGTVYGMITCFEHAASTDAASRAESLARGIYAALVTTAAGLSVAIPAYVLYHWFLGKVERVIDEIEESANALLDGCFEREETRGSRAPAAAGEGEVEAGGGTEPHRSPAVSPSAPQKKRGWSATGGRT